MRFSHVTLYNYRTPHTYVTNDIANIVIYMYICVCIYVKKLCNIEERSIVSPCNSVGRQSEGSPPPPEHAFLGCPAPPSAQGLRKHGQRSRARYYAPATGTVHHSSPLPQLCPP
ncbi:hypothetical protein, unlikely [Trypanosoma congolense IL3000]|uniref:Uncharacterized protein n=1 Tax=Trypanosoma congolense (strain IL3000) TaxID=1068625 RepID=F9WBI6_TRYCI|nr:hypothetical protein, unlikely [Trypanosoma congolense IL3000]